MAKNCELCAVKVLGSSGSGSWSGIIDGLEHVVDHCQQHWAGEGLSNYDGPGMKCVANMSIGGGRSDTLNRAVRNAADAGVVVVVAAGNDNDNACQYSPAMVPEAITVGSTSHSNGYEARSSFSNYGSCVDVYAPGSDIKSAGRYSRSDTDTKSGTSMASPRKCCILFSS